MSCPERRLCLRRERCCTAALPRGGGAQRGRARLAQCAARPARRGPALEACSGFHAPAPTSWREVGRFIASNRPHPCPRPSSPRQLVSTRATGRELTHLTEESNERVAHDAGEVAGEGLEGGHLVDDEGTQGEGGLVRVVGRRRVEARSQCRAQLGECELAVVERRRVRSTSLLVLLLSFAPTTLYSCATLRTRCPVAGTGGAAFMCDRSSHARLCARRSSRSPPRSLLRPVAP